MNIAREKPAFYLNYSFKILTFTRTNNNNNNKKPEQHWCIQNIGIHEFRIVWQCSTFRICFTQIQQNLHEHIVRRSEAKTPTIVYNIVNVIVSNFAYNRPRAYQGGIRFHYYFVHIFIETCCLQSRGEDISICINENVQQQSSVTAKGNGSAI